jgi:lantibiotic transport system permease protein
MTFIELIGIELHKIKRSKILLILILPAIILWIPAVANAGLNFHYQKEGISPENSFLIQTLLGFAWFMYPAGMVINTVLLTQTERGSRGIIKMLSLPLNSRQLCLAKFIVLLILAAAQISITTFLYFPSAFLASHIQNYNFLLSPLLVWKEAGLLFMSSLPMTAVFWLIAVGIRTPVFAIGTGLASIVPSIILINSKVWFIYPMCYPFYVITTEYGKLASNFETFSLTLFPWIPVAIAFLFISTGISCLQFGKSENK